MSDSLLVNMFTFYTHKIFSRFEISSFYMKFLYNKIRWQSLSLNIYVFKIKNSSHILKNISMIIMKI